MAAKTFYLKNATASGSSALSLQDGGTAPTAAITTTGWTVAKLAAANMSQMQAGTKKTSGTFGTADAIPSFAQVACWRSENTLDGVFANSNWTFTFRVRAVSAAASQAGRIKIRVWRSASATGASAVQLTSAVLVGSTTAALSTTASQSSAINWAPGGTHKLTNEYLWVQCEWEITTAGGSNSADAVFYIESTATVVTPDFIVPVADAWNAADKSFSITLTNADKTATHDSASAGGVRSTRSNTTTGKYYAEFLVATTGGNFDLGWIGPGSALTGSTAAVAVDQATGDIWDQPVKDGSLGVAGVAGDVYSAAIDFAARLFWFRINNGNWNNDPAADPGAGTGGFALSYASNVVFHLYAQTNVDGAVVHLRTEIADFTQTAPSGFSSWMGEALPTADAWNANDKHANITLTNSDKTADGTSSNQGVRSTKTRSTGKYYAEFVYGVTHSSQSILGFKDITAARETFAANTFAVMSTGTSAYWYRNGTQVQQLYIGGFAAGDVLSVAWDADAKLAWARVNAGNWNNSGSANPATGVGGLDVSSVAGTDFALWKMTNSATKPVTLRTEAAEFTQTLPSGFLSWMGETLAQPVYSVEHYRWRNDGQLPDYATPQWVNPEDKPLTAWPAFGALQYHWGARVRFTIQNTGTDTPPGVLWKLHYSKNGGAYVPLTGASNQGLNQWDTGVGDNVPLTVQRLTSGAGVWSNGQQDWTGETSALVIDAGKFTEIEFSVLFNYTQVAEFDTFDLRVYAGSTPINWDFTPRVGATRFQSGNAYVTVPTSGVNLIELLEDASLGAAHTVTNYFVPVAGSKFRVTFEFKGVGPTPRGHLTLISSPNGYIYSSARADGVETVAVIGNGDWVLLEHSCVDVGGGWFGVTLAGICPDNGTSTQGGVVIHLRNDTTHYYDGANDGSGIQFRNYLLTELIPATGTGALNAQPAALVSNLALSSSSGSGTAPAQPATLVASGAAAWTGTGALAAVFVGATRTNYVLNSQELSGSGWLRTGQTLTSNNATAPDSTLTADTVAITSASAMARNTVTPSNVGATAGTYTVSYHAKYVAGGPPYLRIETADWGTGAYFAHFNLQNGTVGDKTAGLTTWIEPLADGWYRCGFTAFFDLANNVLYMEMYYRDAAQAATVVSGQCILWGLQLEKASAPTAYIPTTTAPVTVTDTMLAGRGLVETPAAIGTGTLSSDAAALVGSGINRWVVSSATLTPAAAVVAAPGIASSTASGVLAASVTTLTGSGLYETPPRTGTGALSSTATLSGAGVNRWVATGALTSTATLAAAGIASSSASGVMAVTVAAISGAGLVETPPAIGTGALASTDALLIATGSARVVVVTAILIAGAPTLAASGTAASAVTSATLVAGTSALAGTGGSVSTPVEGSGALAATADQLAGFATSGSVGTSILTVGTASLAATGESRVTASGVLVAQAGALPGAGISSSRSITAALNAQSNFLQLGIGLTGSTGAAALTASSAVTVSTGRGTSSGSGALPVAAAALSGAGSVYEAGAAFGSLYPTASAITASGVSRSVVTSAAALCLPSTLSAVGVNLSTGAGAVPSTSASLTSIGLVASVGTASLSPQAAGLTASGTSGIIGAGVLTVGASALTSAGVARWAASGALGAGVAAAAGAGASATSGSGVIVPAAATLFGSGTFTAYGPGVLVATDASMLGTGAVAEGGLGIGALSPSAATLAGLGQVVAATAGTGALAASVAAVAGAGSRIWTASGDLIAQDVRFLSSSGVARWIATGVLTGGASSIVGDAAVRWAASGALPSGAAAIAGTGVREMLASGALLAQVAKLSGAGRSGYAASGELEAQATALTGIGHTHWASSGALLAGVAQASGSGTSSVTGAGAIVSRTASVLGSEGTVIVQGMGALQAANRLMTGAGTSRSFGFGSLIVADSSDLVAAGQSGAVGTGSLLSTRSALQGIALGQALGVAALEAAAARFTAGSGFARWVASGTLAVGSSALTASGVARSVGTAVLATSRATLQGEGLVAARGSAMLASKPASLTGQARSGSVGIADLIARDRVIVGAGGLFSTGTGVLRQSKPTLAATAISGSVGTAVIVSKPATVTGFASLTAWGGGALITTDATITGDDVLSGTGALPASSATIAGSGEVGEAVPWTPSPMPGSYPGTTTWGAGAMTATWGGQTTTPTLPPPPWWLGKAA